MLICIPRPTIMIDPFTLSMILIVLLALAGLSVGLAMMCGSFVYLILKGFDPSIAAEQLLQGLFNGYTLLAIPLFILAADIMNLGSLADKLLRFCQALVGRFRGGLGHVNVVSSVIFSGMSGSAVADAVGMGKIIITMMAINASANRMVGFVSRPIQPPNRGCAAASSAGTSDPRWLGAVWACNSGNLLGRCCRVACAKSVSGRASEA